LPRLPPKVAPLPVREVLGGLRHRSTSCHRSIFPLFVLFSPFAHFGSLCCLFKLLVPACCCAGLSLLSVVLLFFFACVLCSFPVLETYVFYGHCLFVWLDYAQ
jgi:hypothetical protein